MEMNYAQHVERTKGWRGRPGVVPRAGLSQAGVNVDPPQAGVRPSLHVSKSVLLTFFKHKML